MENLRGRNSMQIAGRLLAGAGVAIVLGFSYIVWNFNQPPFRLEKLQLLQKGMSKPQVTQILGEPDSKFDTSWAYSRPGSWPIVKIYFDDQGLFAESEYDY